MTKNMRFVFDKYASDDGLSYHGLLASLEYLHYEPSKSDIKELKSVMKEKRRLCFPCFLQIFSLIEQRDSK